MDEKTYAHYAAPVQSFSTIDVVNGETLEKNVFASSVLVTDEADLANLPPYPAGTIAYTAGFQAIWQLSAAGEWVSVL